MVQKDARMIQAELTRPFAPEDLEWRLQRTYDDRQTGGKRGIAVPYVTNRAIQARLDDVVGPDGWYNEYKPWHSDGKKNAQICGISIYFPERGFITKWDGAEDSDIEPVKGGLSDSMKRAAVQWGIGRCLYGMDVVFVDVEQRGNSWVIKRTERSKLDKAYTDMLTRMKLVPALAGGMQSTLTPKAAGTAPAPEPQPRPAPVQPLPQPKPDGKAEIYTVIAARLEQRPSSTTHVLLAKAGGEQLHAFAMGDHPELVAGIQLTGVKLAMRQQDTVVYYILEDYRIVALQNQAA